MLGFDLAADIVNDEHEAIGIARMIRDDEATDAVCPIPVLVGLVGHHDHNVIEGLAGDNAVDGVAAMVEPVSALMAQNEVGAVFVDGSTKFVEGGDPMHLERSLIGIGDGLVWLDQDHALGQRGNDLLQLRTIRGVITRGAGCVLGQPRNISGTHGLWASVTGATHACTSPSHEEVCSVLALS